MNELITLTAALTVFYLVAMLFSAAILKAEKVWTKIKRRKK
jgi:hypothetical protein